MNNFQLKKQNAQHPDINELQTIFTQIKKFAQEKVQLYSKEWLQKLEEILTFQDKDGGFRILDSDNVESDARVCYCYYPSYYCTGILMKVYLSDKNLLFIDEKNFKNALDFCCGKNLRGHGYDALKEQIEIMDFFISCGLKDFIADYPTLSPEFTSMIRSIVNEYKKCIEEKKFFYYYDKSHEDDFNRIVNALSVTASSTTQKLFVYGTLLKGMRANQIYLKDAKFLGNAQLNGYAMYDLGNYPGIVPETNGLVQGELYEIDSDLVPQLDIYEGIDGGLYKKTEENVTVGWTSTHKATVYVYNRSVCGKQKIYLEKGTYREYLSMKKEANQYVWYACYGSNLLFDRFKTYITGGECVYKGKPEKGCIDKTLPIQSRPVEIPYNMYYGKKSSSWGNLSVSFLDDSQKGHALGRAYLVTKEQFEEIHSQEGITWYNKELELEPIDGIPAKTFTSDKKETYYGISPEYAFTIICGLKETYPEIGDNTLFSYFKSTLKRS